MGSKRDQGSREKGEEDARGQAPSHTASQPQSKSENMIKEVRKGKSPDAKGSWNNFRKAG